jgi:hypothetical protein
MKNFLFYAFLSVLFSACTNPESTESPAWAAFKKCATNACVKEGVDVKNAFLNNPQQLLTNFQATYAKGEDHVIGWLYMMRDSLLLNPKMGTIEARMALQQKLIAAAKPFENDPKVKEMAKSVIDEIGAAAILSETEDDEAIDPSSDPTTGTYSYDKGDSGNGDLDISQISADKFKFKVSVTGGPPSHTGGFMEGVATLVQNKGTYSTKEFGECTLEFTFGKDVTIKTLKGDPASCGFGMNVMADGVYPRKSYNDPFLSKKDAANATKLIGEWQSTSDPKSSIKIGDGIYRDIYTGEKEMPALRYIYYPVCPKDCNPVAKTPCLRVIGQDDMCYSIIKADGKTLELSLIGGAGKTNSYVKKK